jgi:hypothetical protein
MSDVDLIVTPTRSSRCLGPGPRRPGRILWDELTTAKVTAIPVLAELRKEAE